MTKNHILYYIQGSVGRENPGVGTKKGAGYGKIDH